MTNEPCSFEVNSTSISFDNDLHFRKNITKNVVLSHIALYMT